MSLQALQQFRAHANGNAQMQSAVRTCLTGDGGVLDLGALAALGKRNGFEFSAEDVRTAMAATDDELSDFELEVVSGGLPCNQGGGETGWGS